jgi:hypothetical protein
VFDLTEEQTYASLKLFLEFRQPSASNFKTIGQPQCAHRKSSHPAEQCWIIHPDLKPKYCNQEECNKKRARHTAERCWILHPNLNPHKKNKSSVTSSSEDEDDDGDDEGVEEGENYEEEQT